MNDTIMWVCMYILMGAWCSMTLPAETWTRVTLNGFLWPVMIVYCFYRAWRK